MSNVKLYIWSGLGNFGTEILSFIGNVLIARILLPSDYGLVAMLSIFMSLAMNLSDAGFNDCLIRKKDCDNKDIGTVATYNMFVATLFYMLMYFAAPYIACFFNRTELVEISRILMLAFVLKSFTLSGFVQLNKSLKFKHKSIILLLSSFLSLLCTYIMALNGYGYWSLVFQPIFVSIYNVIFLLIVAKWRPYFCFYWDRFKSMFAFSSNLLISYFITNIGNNIYSLIIGKFYSASSLGFYNQAHKMQIIPTQGINNVILTTSYPLIAKEKDADKRYNLYVTLFDNFNFIIIYMVFSLLCCSDSIFLIILGDKWLPSSSLFQLFILIALTYPLMTINSNIIKIAGKSNIYRNLSLVRTSLQVVALLVCANLSLHAIILGQVLASFISVSIDMKVCGKYINFTCSQQYKKWFIILYKPLIAFTISILFLDSIRGVLLHDSLTFLVFLILSLLLSEIMKDNTYLKLKQRLFFKNKL